ncbi:MAG: hypothetical protein ACKN94_13150 [Pirellulaceae bacterium]
MKETMREWRLELQRLVDGALSTQDRSVLLRRIDESPELWRVVALQFLEDQALRSVLGTEASGGQQVAAIHMQGDAIEDAVASKGSFTETRSNHPLVSEPATKIPTSAEANVPRGWAAAKWLAVAATFFAILGAYQAGNRAGNQTGRGGIDRPVPQQSGLAQSFMKPEGRLLMPVGNSSENMLEIPVFQVPQIDPSWVQAPLPEKWESYREALRRDGLDLQLETEVIEGKLPDGRHLIVPVRSVRIERRGL